MKRFSPFRSIVTTGVALGIALSPAFAQSVGKITYRQDEPVKAVAYEAPVRTHTVKEGETLSKIAKANNVSVADLAEINGLENKNRIYVGQVLKLERRVESVTPIRGATARMAPSTTQRTITQEEPEYYLIKKGDDIFSISDTREVTVAQLKAWNPTANFTEGERVIVGKQYHQVQVGGESTTPPNANARLAGSLADVASTTPSPASSNALVTPAPSTPIMTPKDAGISRGFTPTTMDKKGRQYALPNLKPAGTLAMNQRFGEVNDPRITDMRFYVHHKTLPIGSRINVLLPENSGYVEAEVVGRLAPESSADIGLSPDLMKMVQGARNLGLVTISYN